MAEEFTPITSQEQLDSVIGDRLKRERETVTKKYADYNDLKSRVSDYETQVAALQASLDESAQKIAGYEAEKSELTSRISAYEASSVRMRIAREVGIPYELADRLSGDSEDAIREDAKNFSQYLVKNSTPPPLGDTEGEKGGSSGSVYAQLLSGLNLKGE